MNEIFEPKKSRKMRYRHNYFLAQKQTNKYIFESYMKNICFLIVVTIF